MLSSCLDKHIQSNSINIRHSEANFRRVSMSCYSGITITGGTVGILVMGDGSNKVRASNVLDDYSFIRLNAIEPRDQFLFRCTSGLGPSGNISNNDIGNIFFNNTSLNAVANKINCTGFVRVTGARSTSNLPGVYSARVCKKFTTSEEGVYTCRLMNSSMMYQNMSIGLYFRGRSKLQIMYNE